jgi:hypothetical protein
MLLFAGFALVDGLLAIFVALIDVAANKRGWILLHGVASIVLAVFTFIRISNCISLKSARRFRMLPRTPPVSPDFTMLT